MRFLVLILACLLCPLAQALSAFDQRMIQAGTPYFPLITSAYATVWPDAPMRSATAAMIEKESRWNPYAELCVPKPTCSRERGIGLGQFTITQKFNVFQEVARLHPRLTGWHPSQYTDPEMQIVGIVAKTKMHHRQCTPLMKGSTEVMACVASSYNGGHGGVLADRRLCGNTKGCEPALWFGHVEHTSMKAKVPLTGYGQSFFQINRAYARGVIFEWRPKYIVHLGN